MIKQGDAGNFDGTIYDNLGTGKAAVPTYDPALPPPVVVRPPDLTTQSASKLSFDVVHQDQSLPVDTLAIAPRVAAIPTPAIVPDVGATIIGTSPASNGNVFVDEVPSTSTAVAPPPDVTATGSAGGDSGSTTQTGSSGGTNDTQSTADTLLQFLASTLGDPQPVQASMAPVDFAPLDAATDAPAATSAVDVRGLLVVVVLLAAIGGGGYYWYKHRRARG
jgi:hypothetical protein